MDTPGTYVCHGQEEPIASNLLPSMLSQIPVIDMEMLLASDHSQLEKLHLACKDWGFFQVYIYTHFNIKKVSSYVIDVFLVYMFNLALL